MIEGYTIHRQVLPPEVLAEVHNFLEQLEYTRTERGIIYLERALQSDNTGNEQARYLIALLKANGLDQFIAFDDVSVVHYRDSADYVDWHSDGGPLLNEGCAMGVLSLGDTRVMEFRHIDGDQAEASETLNANDLVVSREGFQSLYQHRIPPKINGGERFSIVLFTHNRRKKKNG
jgi:alkylated DNA repair dioxygenase AlkB